MKFLYETLVTKECTKFIVFTYIYHELDTDYEKTIRWQLKPFQSVESKIVRNFLQSTEGEQ